MKKTVSILTALFIGMNPMAQRASAHEATTQAQQNVEESKASKVLGALKNGANKVAGGVKFVGNKACEGVKFAGKKVAEHPGVTAAVVLGSAALGGLGYLGYNTHSNWGKIVESYQNGDSFFTKIKDILKLAFGVKNEDNKSTDNTTVIEDNKNTDNTTVIDDNKSTDNTTVIDDNKSTDNTTVIENNNEN